MARAARIARETRETAIVVELVIDGAGETAISTGIAFFDHMLEQLGRHAGFDLRVDASGDLDVDDHHTVEDVGIVLGSALNEALGDKEGIARYGNAVVPMDEALVMCSLDLSGRPYLAYDVPVSTTLVGTFQTGLVEEFLRALVNTSKMTLHLKLLDGRDPHHVLEATFKSIARALGAACALTGRSGLPSTKGRL